MAGRFVPSRELEELTSAALGGQIDVAQIEKLEALLRADINGLRWYRDMVGLHIDLRILTMANRSNQRALSNIEAIADQSSSPGENQAVPSRPFNKKQSQPNGLFGCILRVRGDSPAATALSWMVMAICTCGVVLTLAFVGLILRHGGARDDQTNEEKPRSETPRVTSNDSGHRAAVADSSTVARLTRAIDCRWAGGRRGPKAGDDFAPGRTLTLDSGFAEIIFQGGVRTLLEGPATLEIRSRMGAYLRQGKLTVRVEDPLVRGFAVSAPGMKYTDLGTEFGISVEADGQQELQVFQGSVAAEEERAQDVAPAGTDRRADDAPAQSPHAPLIVTAQQGARVTAAKKSIERIAAGGQTFVRAEQLTKIAGEHSAEFHRWRKFSDDLCKRPDLVAYYDFQPDESDRTILRNRSSAGRPLDGKIAGDCRWVDGRLPGKFAIDFDKPEAQVKVNIPGELPELTLAAWVRIDELANRSQGLFMSDGWGERGGVVHWQVDRLGELLLSCHMEANHSTKVAVGGGSGIGLEPKSLGRWRHFASAYSSRAGKLLFCIDGKKVREIETGQAVAMPGEVALGNWHDKSSEKAPFRILNGCMDELMLFNKALDAGEIRDIAAAGSSAEAGQ